MIIVVWLVEYQLVYFKILLFLKTLNTRNSSVSWVQFTDIPVTHTHTHPVCVLVTYNYQ